LLDYSREKINSKEIQSATFDSSTPVPIGLEKKLETKLKKLKKLLFEKLYLHKNIVIKMYAGKQAIIGLYNGLMEEEKMLPEEYYAQLKTRKKHRVVADYIASMSDRYAINFYKEMYGRL
jgi:dGTPase